jgi:catechol 2,3-dioxygenase-like lactoylglutathione lyase family enzyme
MAAPRLRRLVRFGLTTSALAPLTDFYVQALGCSLLAIDERTRDRRARSALLALGSERIELLEFEQPGAPYPPGLAASNPRFQHFAVVVADMAAAHAQLQRLPGWQPISHGGPQRLPANTGHVSAFKFRDPDGHPLELLAFAPGQAPARWRRAPGAALFLGLDHSAISVTDSGRSVAFYESLGLHVSATTLNRGPEQARLDGLAAPEVRVTALGLPEGGPHLELLGYQGVAQAAPAALPVNDIAATRLVFEGSADLALTDPDGHHLLSLDAQRPRQKG